MTIGELQTWLDGDVSVLSEERFDSVDNNGGVLNPIDSAPAGNVV